MTHERTAMFVRALLIIAVCSLAQAQQPLSKDEKSEELRTGAITGRVVNDNGQPIASANVSVRAFGLAQGRTTTTDSEGNFQINGLDAAAYQVFYSAASYITMPRDPDSPQPPYSRIGDSLRLELVKGGVITGVVTNSADEPVVYVIVRAHMISDSRGQPPRYEMSFRQKATDDRGVYRIYGLAPGTYIVSAGNGTDYYSRFNTSAYDSDVPTYAPSSTRDTAAQISVHAGEEIANVDIRYRGEQGHVVSGVARGGANALESLFAVTLTTASNQGMRMNLTTSQQGDRGFAFFGVADGDYDLTAQTFVPGGESNLSEPRRIKVRGSDVTGIELLAKPLGTILGRVTLLESKTPECKNKRRPLFAETVISAWHNERDATKDLPTFIWGLGGPTLPDTQGNFTLRNLAPGQYRISTRPFAKYWYLQSISLPAASTPATTKGAANRTIDAARNWIALKHGDRISGLVLELAEGAASVHGQMNLLEGQKLPARTFVYLIPAEREKAEDVLRFYVSQVEADGTFAMNNLAPGRYWALTRAARENESNLLSTLRLPEEAEARSNLRRDAETAKTQIELKPCQNVLNYKLPLN